MLSAGHSPPPPPSPQSLELLPVSAALHAWLSLPLLVPLPSAPNHALPLLLPAARLPGLDALTSNNNPIPADANDVI